VSVTSFVGVRDASSGGSVAAFAGVGGTTIEGSLDEGTESPDGGVEDELAAGGVAAQAIWTKNVRNVAETSAMRFMGKLLRL
jgi:hypothetical protein